VRALESLKTSLKGGVELHFTYDEEFGGELGPGWLLKQKLTKPDLLLAAAFSYQVVTAHNGCLQMEVTVHGRMGHAAVPDTAVDALQAATKVLNALYHQNTLYKQVTSRVPGITHPYLNVGRIEGGTNTNVVPGKVLIKLDRRMIPEENPAEVEARASAWTSSASCWRIHSNRCPATSRWWTHCAAMRASCSASRSDLQARRCIPTRACTANRASRRHCTAAGRAPCWKATPSAPTSTSSWKTCGAPRRWWHAPCSTCCTEKSHHMSA
jgi:acetylornithine deacetylase/succinyl-diaminopimelate desuccinylase-like protein